MDKLKTYHKTISARYARFIYTNSYVALLTLLSVIAFIFDLEIYMIFFLTIVFAVHLILVRDLLPIFLPLLLIGMVPLKRYGEVDYFYPVLLYTLIYMVPAFILRGFIFPIKLIKGRFFYPTLAVSASIILGGLFSISIEDYFSLRSIYYVIFLGPMMVFFYIILEHDLPKRRDMGEYLAKIFLGIGVMGVSMFILSLVKDPSLVDENFPRSIFQWNNNVSNNLLLALPFPFYLALKRRHPMIYFSIGIMIFITLIFMFSRGGMLMAMGVFPLTFFATLYLSGRNRLKLFGDFLVMMIVILALLRIFVGSIPEIIDAMIENVTISSTESRALMYRYAIEVFLKYPLFGTGLGHDVQYYNPQPMAMFWYHSTVFQIIGSLGLAGIIAYTYQMLMRGKTLIEVKSKFNLYVFFSILGFAGYSLVNVGYFIPLPFGPTLIMIFIITKRLNDFYLTDLTYREKETIKNVAI
ncbi:MAG: O-antigen ligase family protein [Candidatus Izemoplasmataceae bacterium]